MNPQPDLSELPLKSFYRLALPAFTQTGAEYPFCLTMQSLMLLRMPKEDMQACDNLKSVRVTSEKSQLGGLRFTTKLF